WGSRAEIDGNDGVWLRVLVDAISAKPELIRAVLRADRYQDSIEARQPRGAATINTFPFFASAPFADDLVERSIESLRRDATRPAEAITSLDGFVLVTAEQMEVNLLLTWQMLCGVCGRL